MCGRLSRSTLKIGFLVTAIAGCATPPKTANEFRQISRSRNGTHELVVKVPLETVVNRIKVHAQKCNDFGWTMSRREGLGGNPAGMKYSDRQLIRWENLNTNKPTFLITAEGKQDLNRQKGGFYMFLIDLVGRGGETALTMYDFNYSWGYYDWATEFKAVVNNQKATCQLDASK